jgi:hypothetical protein
VTTLNLTAVPDALVDRLRAVAERAATDLTAAALRCLERGLSDQELAEADIRELQELRSPNPDAWVTDEMIRAARDEGRP